MWEGVGFLPNFQFPDGLAHTRSTFASPDTSPRGRCSPRTSLFVVVPDNPREKSFEVSHVQLLKDFGSLVAAGGGHVFPLFQRIVDFSWTLFPTQKAVLLKNSRWTFPPHSPSKSPPSSLLPCTFSGFFLQVVEKLCGSFLNRSTGYTSPRPIFPSKGEPPPGLLVFSALGFPSSLVKRMVHSPFFSTPAASFPHTLPLATNRFFRCI